MAKYRVKGSTRRKLMQTELSKELKSQAKKTNPKRQKAKEHELFEMIDKGLGDE